MQIREFGSAPSLKPFPSPVAIASGPTAPGPQDLAPPDVGRRRSLDLRLDAYMTILAENKKVGDLTDAEIHELDSRGAQIGADRSARSGMTAREAVRLSNADPSGEIRKMLSQRPDLRSEDLYEEDASGNRSLRPALANADCRATLAARPDLRPVDLQTTRDPKTLTTLSKRRDLRPGDLVRMKEGFHSRLKPYFPPVVAAALAEECSDQSMELMQMRGPDTRPESLLRFYDTIHGAVGATGGQQTPFLFLKGVGVMKQRPDLTPDGMSALTASVGEAGFGADSSVIGGCLDRCYTALENPNIQPGQIMGLAAASRVVPDPGARMEAVGRAALELQPAGESKPKGRSGPVAEPVAQAQQGEQKTAA